MIRNLPNSQRIINNKKKRYLRQYRSLLKRESELAQQLLEVSLIVDAPPQIDHKLQAVMPYPDYPAVLAIANKEYHEAREEREKLHTEITEAISQLKNPSQRDILTLHFIEGYTFKQIAKEVGYTERWIYDLYLQAIIAIKI